MSHTNGLSVFLGIDVGAETFKVVELTRDGKGLRWTRRYRAEHHKDPAPLLRSLLEEWGWASLTGAAVCGRFGRRVRLTHIPTQQAQARGVRFLHGDKPATVISIGGHGFSVLELRDSGAAIYRQNSRCSQGTGNFLNQLVARFHLNIVQAGDLCAGVENAAALSGRCPVILKTDITHLANKGESQARIVAGLYDAVCENVQALIKPRVSPTTTYLIGGVTQSVRIRDNFRKFLAAHHMKLHESDNDDAQYVEALGTAVLAAEQSCVLPALAELIIPVTPTTIETTPGLTQFTAQVKRLTRKELTAGDGKGPLILGFDIGSTGSKMVALDVNSRDCVWEYNTRTNGNPVGAAQELMQAYTQSIASHRPVAAVAVTGSGREIVGSLLATCYGTDKVFVMNEIAAHAEGALKFNSEVDTIFEIGGQDAKYIRLAGGRVVDAAMNEACSAGTGSFIEEQGRQFSGISSVEQLGALALAAEKGISLGQHCSVFMAEVIDDAMAAGVEQSAIVAGIYDSIIQNYLNRVKGNRSVGSVIFCQGMPFAATALAAAVARQTGSRVIVPPNPGTIGAFGIALLACRHLELDLDAALEPERFLAARVTAKDTFICSATRGCGEPGNKCRIDRLTTTVAGTTKRFTWGGGCSMHDQGARKRKLPDLTPDPFREREALVAQLLAGLSTPRGGVTVALTDEFQSKGLFPFFTTFLHELGCDLKVFREAGREALKRGIEQANVPFCAPMQLQHGQAASMAECGADYLFLPMIRSLERQADEPCANTCPIVQASPDIIRSDLAGHGPKMLSPIVNTGREGLSSKEFRSACRSLARELGMEKCWQNAWRKSVAAQRTFDAQCLDIGRRALTFCKEHSVMPVIVLGRIYTIYNQVLNSNVPALLREQGALAIPVDCYPIDGKVPKFDAMYWAYGQRLLRASHQVRRTPGQYAIFCSNYACGPDSFNQHFFAYIMDGRPFAVIETDGHSGDAGTKTRVEAFLHCAREDLAAQAEQARATREPHSFKELAERGETLAAIRRSGRLVLLPPMGPSTHVLAACLRGLGVPTEALPPSDRETLRHGRRYTSGKECLPTCLTLGSLLQRLASETDPAAHFVFFIPKTEGPCRLGAYHMLQKIVIERTGWADRVSFWTPCDTDLFDGLPVGYSALVYAGSMGLDLLLEGLHDTRPVAHSREDAQAVYERYRQELLLLLERQAGGDLTIPGAIYATMSGTMYGITDLLRRAGHELAALRSKRELPTVMVTGEIYVRCEPFANDNVIEKLEARGFRVRLASFGEMLEYSDHIAKSMNPGPGQRLSSFLQSHMRERAYRAIATPLGWHPRMPIKESLAAAAPYMRDALEGEAVQTIGTAVRAWQLGEIVGVVSVGPHECMPNKIAEAQFHHVMEKEGLPSLTLGLNGEPLDPEALDSFAFAVMARWRKDNTSSSSDGKVEKVSKGDHHGNSHTRRNKE